VTRLETIELAEDTMSITISIEKAAFRILNRYIVVPGFKRGLGRLISNPVVGRIMVLKLVGRRTGKIRYTPVNYAVIGENLYCYQGRHLKGEWYLNILANPRVEVILPDRTLKGFAEQVKDEEEAASAILQILKGSGLGAFIYGFNPFTATDDVLREKTAGIPVIKIRPIGAIMSTHWLWQERSLPGQRSCCWTSRYRLWIAGIETLCARSSGLLYVSARFQAS
jgi:deazaflavin-dependent oxidoreductase (nitroreductase family)